MSKLIYFKRYLFIIERLRSYPSNFIDLQQFILQKLTDNDLESSFEFSTRTFDRDKTEIHRIFGILIQYNRSTKMYFIEEDAIEEIATNRIIDAFSIHQAIQNGDKLTPKIFLEKRKSLGTENINGLIHAVQNQYFVHFIHQSHEVYYTTKRIVKPLAIKESQHRWYLIAEDQKDQKIKTFGLDRISNLEITNTKFKAVLYDVEQEFKHAFGVETYEPADKIVLQFSPQQGKYAKTFPLHHSQEVVIENQDIMQVSLFMHPTNDFIMELLKFGANVKIIEPKSLQNEMKIRIQNALNRYQ
jgi:proteasome accessory factor B